MCTTLPPALHHCTKPVGSLTARQRHPLKREFGPPLRSELKRACRPGSYPTRCNGTGSLFRPPGQLDMTDDRPPAAKASKSVAYFFDEELCNYNYGGAWGRQAQWGQAAAGERPRRRRRRRRPTTQRGPAGQGRELAWSAAFQCRLPPCSAYVRSSCQHCRLALQHQPHTTRPAACCAGGNPMRPHRHRLTTNLVRGYGLDDKMKVFRPPPRSREEIMHFHADGASGGVGATLGLVRWPPAPCALLAAEGGFREGRRRGSAAQPMESRHEACPPCPLLHSPTSLPSCALAPANQTICKLSMCPARRLCGLPHLCDAGEPGRIHDAGARGRA